jgi:hypothetical protein
MVAPNRININLKFDITHEPDKIYKGFLSSSDGRLFDFFRMNLLNFNLCLKRSRSMY